MDRQEYKRQNEKRDADRQTKLLDDSIAEQKELRNKGWRRHVMWRPVWWNIPSDRFAFLVAVFTGALVIVGYYQLSAIRSQLNEMQAEQRPWIYADTPIVTRPITQNKANVWELRLKFIIHNVGHLPGSFVTPWVDSPVPIINRGNLVEEAQQRQCRKERTDLAYVGDTVFPGQTIEREITVGIWPKDWDDVVFAGVQPSPWLIGCISYIFPEERGIHVTKFAYVMSWVRPAEPYFTPFPHDLNTVPLDQLRISPFPVKDAFGAN
jgi:hypothetical protein